MSSTPVSATADCVWADAQPFRAHVHEILCETGTPWRILSALSGVAPRTMRKLLHGRVDGTPVRSIHIVTARALAAMSVDDVLAAEETTVDVRPTRALLCSLQTLGWSRTNTARWIHGADWDHVMSRKIACSTATAARVQACYDLLTERPPTAPRAGAPRADGVLEHA